MSQKFRILVSSVQKELAAERRTVRDFIEGDALLRRFFDVFLFEDLPASDRRADNVYLNEVDHCSVYVGLFGREYGGADRRAKSPTEQEFNRATAKGKTRLIFVKGADDKGRDPRMLQLIHRAGSQLIRRRFQDVPDLTAALYASLVEHLERSGRLRTLPFDAAACPRAALEDIDDDRVSRFLRTARQERRFALRATASAEETLAHLNLLDGRHPSHAAILLFGRNPQRFLPSAEVKCLHFHGTEIRKPIPSYQLFKGTAFEQVDQAVDFVLAKIARAVAGRAQRAQTAVEYELPKAAITEAIVNAVAHRDYASNAGVQVMLFADRVEVWNPGELPPPLTPERLRAPHASIPRNPLIAEPLFLAHYIEKAGTGTLDMIAACRAAGLPEPTFEQRAGQFVTTLWRDWLNEAVMEELTLNERQKTALSQLSAVEKITNAEYQRVTAATRKTAARDLEDLVGKGVLEPKGAGRGAHYVRRRKRDNNGTNRTSKRRRGNGT